MKKIFTLIAVAMFIGALNVNAQCTGDRYKLPVFGGADLTSDIIYGNNVSYTGASEDLKLDVYQPTGDIETSRPLVIIAHGGNFTGGSKTGSDVAPLAQDFAKMGYVVASIDYRVGFEGLFSGTLDSVFATETVIRAVHDYRAAIRFFKKDFSENGNTYGIDTSLIFATGVSAGAITAVHVGYMDDIAELPTYVDTTKVGLGGGIEGNSGNPNYTSSGLAGVVNIAGALRDTNWITSTSIPILSLHGDLDGTVPYATDIIWLLGTYEIMKVDGSFSIHKRANNVGVTNCFHTHFGADHVPHVGNATYTDTTETMMSNFMASFVCNEILVCGTNDTIIDFSIDPNATTAIDESFVYGTKIYPNPSSNIVNIESDVAIESVQLTNLLGELVISKTGINSNKVQITKSNLPSGVYILSINTINGPITKKIIFE